MTLQTSRIDEVIPLKKTEFPYSPTTIPGLIRILDAICVFSIGIICFLFLTPDFGLFGARYIWTVLFISIAYLLIAQYANLYSINAIMRPISRADDILVALITAFMLFFSVALALEATDIYPLRTVAIFCGLAFMIIVAARLAACRLLGRLSRRKIIGRTMVVLGVGEQSRRFLRWMHKANPYFVSLVGVFDEDGASVGAMVEDHPVLGGAEMLLAYARNQKIDDVVVALPWNADQKLAETVETLKELPINVYLATDLAGFELAFRPVMGNLSELPMFEVVQRPISGWSSALKAIEDLLFASIILMIISPIMVLIAIAIKTDSKGPIFFKQARLGFNNKPFNVYKFRSMYHTKTPETVVVQATKNDPRVTRVGRFIRATSLDELPQIFNVLDGTMSLVGPRPHALSHNEEYGRRIRGYFARHRVKPGITGWAQVNGLRGETRTLDKMEARIRYDIYYAENWSILFDLRILAMTVLVVLFQKSAY